MEVNTFATNLCKTEGGLIIKGGVMSSEYAIRCNRNTYSIHKFHSQFGYRLIRFWLCICWSVRDCEDGAVCKTVVPLSLPSTVLDGAVCKTLVPLSLPSTILDDY